MNQEVDFKDYIDFLKEHLTSLRDYRRKIGGDSRKIQNLRRALNHQDPFIVFKATFAATEVLNDKAIYH